MSLVGEGEREREGRLIYLFDMHPVGDGQAVFEISRSNISILEGRVATGRANNNPTPHCYHPTFLSSIE